MRLPRRPQDTITRRALLSRRPDGVSRKQSEALIIAVVFVGVLVLLFVSYLVLRHIRKRRTEPPKFLSEYLKKRWRSWSPGTYTSPGPTTRHPSTRSARRNRRQQQERAGGGVDRNTSVRSVMTLPEYRPIAAADRERTIGREGERGGIDVVIEFPETHEEEEERREEHMQTLYEIRLARQLERAALRESGDLTSAAAARRPGTGGSTTTTIRVVPPDPPMSTTTLMAALANLTERERRLSKVQYAEVGVARHDGTRVRPSMDSDRPLLDGSAPMGTTSIRSSYHQRSESGVSYGSAAGTPERRASDEIIRMGSARPSVDTRPAVWQSEDGLLPPSFPTEYDGSEWGPPPDYTSPIETSSPGLPVLRIDTGTPSPGVSRAPSPQPGIIPIPTTTTTTTTTTTL